MSAQYLWLLVFGICFYVIITDQSVARAFYYVMRIVEFHYEKTKWWMIHNPRNPVVKYLIYRRSLKMAEEMMAKINIDKEKE